MAYVTSNPPTLESQRIGGSNASWKYSSTDASTTVDDVDYFTNGDALGMKVGDTMEVIDTDNAYARTSHSVIVVTAGGAATVSAAV